MVQQRAVLHYIHTAPFGTNTGVLVLIHGRRFTGGRGPWPVFYPLRTTWWAGLCDRIQLGTAADNPSLEAIRGALGVNQTSKYFFSFWEYLHVFKQRKDNYGNYSPRLRLVISFLSKVLKFIAPLRSVHSLGQCMDNVTSFVVVWCPEGSELVIAGSSIAAEQRAMMV